MIKQYSRVLSAVLLTFMLSACNDENLLFNLTQEQANQILAILHQHNISAKKDGNLKSGYTVSVSEPESTAALSIINQYQLPWAADVQIGQAFPESSLVASPNAEQARVLSLQEQRLEQSLRMIAQVVNARVHVSYPPLNNDTSGKKTTSHIGVLISYKGEIDDNVLITQIKTLIKNSFDDVRYENISVVFFPAPVIQYVAPTRVTANFPSLWIILFSAIVLCAAITAGFMLYKLSRRQPSATDNAAELIDDEASNP